MNKTIKKKLLLLKDLGIKYPKENSKQKRRYGLYKCFCGKDFEAQVSNIKSGSIKSCGCIKKTHGLGKTKLYKVWHSMVSRCHNIKSQSYNLYGNRGIKVCNEWKNSIISFHNWALENGYKEGLEIDRIDNDGNYEPNNCQWVSSKQNSRNRRQSKLDKDKVDNIKEMLKNKIKQKHIALKYNVDDSCISKINKGKIWA